MASIKKRGINSYQLTASCGYGTDGSKRIKTKTIKVDANLTPKQLAKELERQKVLFQEEVDKGIYMDGDKITFAEYAMMWFNNTAVKHFSKTVLPTYKLRLEKRIIPALGYHKLTKLQPHHLQGFMDYLSDEEARLDVYYTLKPKFIELLRASPAGKMSKSIGITDKTLLRLKDGERTDLKTAIKLCEYFNLGLDRDFKMECKSSKLSTRTIKHHFDLINTILTDAMRENLILYNPMQRIRKVKIKKKEVAFYDDTQIAQLFALLENEPLKYKAVAYTAIDTGLRLAEIAGLEWKHINFASTTISVVQQRQKLSEEYGGETVLDPKTSSGVRTLTLSPTVVNILKAYKREQQLNRLKMGSEWIDSDFVFRHEDGAAMYPSRPYQWLRKFIEKNNLPYITFHGLRHTNASLLVTEIDIATLSGRLGHADKNVTLNMYTHAIKSQEAKAANKMEKFYQRICGSEA